MLHALGFRIRAYHMNEGHSAFLTLELMPRYSYETHEIRPGEPLYDLPRVRALWQAHAAAKTALRERVAQLCGVRLDATLPVLGFARRMTAYKRPDLLFSDLERLTAIARKFPFQLVMSGKAPKGPRAPAG